MALNDSKNKKLQEKVTELQRKEEETRAQKMAEKFSLPYINLIIRPIDLDDFNILPEEKAKEGKMVVIKKTGQVLKIAVLNPQDIKAKKIIEEFQKNGLKCDLLITSLTGLEKAWQHYDIASHPHKDVPLRGIFIIQNQDLKKFKKSLQTIQELEKAISSLSTTKLLTIVLAGAIEMKASDIHIEPTKDKIRLRYRIDGLLQDITDFPNKDYRFFLSRIKTLSDMLLNVHDLSQDGRFTVKIKDRKDEKDIDIRSSVLPSSSGESIVMRLLDKTAAGLSLDQLGIRPELSKTIKAQIKKPNGMILTTGPTGSGKTTTLYACLNFVNSPDKKIITVEDPIEYQQKGITQTQISKRKGRTFATALKSIVRQDPDVLMIGEIRDDESAQIAVQFALTGHLVFSTLHTNDAAGTISRLASMKIKPDLLGSSLNLIIAQRLVRKLCPDCKKAYQPSSDELKTIKKIISSISSKTKIKIPKKMLTLYQAKGCSKCHGLGYRGRIGLFEFLILDQTIKKLILDKVADFEIQKKAQEQGMITLAQDAILKAVEGITTIKETERIVGSLISTNL